MYSTTQKYLETSFWCHFIGVKKNRLSIHKFFDYWFNFGYSF